MDNFIKTLALAAILLVIPSPASAQFKSEVVTRYVLSNVGDYQVIDGEIFVSAESKPVLKAVGKLTIDPGYDSVSIVADDEDRNWVETKKVDDPTHDGETFIIYGSGKVYVIATLAIADPFSVTNKRFVVNIGPAEPDDEDDDDDTDDDEVDPDPPDVPEDKFDNIGQRVAQWAAGKANTAKLAIIFRTASESLRIDPQGTITDITTKLAKDVSKLENASDFKAMRDNVNTDLRARWPLSRVVLAEFYDAVANGLEAVR